MPEILDAEGLDDAAPVVCVCDAPIQGAYRMSIATLRAHLGQVLEFPQHLYLPDPDADWCFVRNMEDDLCFGRPPITTP